MKSRLLPIATALCAALVCLGASLASADVTQTEDLVIKTSDTPKVRFDQTSAGGFDPYAWDIAGNEANFFIRDVTDGSHLPFRIRPGAPSNGITVAENGNVGLGLIDAGAPLQIADGGAVNILYSTTGTTPATWSAGIPAAGDSFAIGIDGAAAALTLRSFGDLDLTGSLSQAANAGSVADVQNVDSAAVLAKLATLPVQTWRFNGAPANARHMGPLAGSFAAAFGLGDNAGRIAPGDVAGVSLAGIQGLIAQNQALTARVGGAEAANAKLGKKLGKLSKQMRKLRKAVAKLAK